MLKTVLVAGGALLASVVTTLFGGSEPASSVAQLVAPGRSARAMDIYLHDRYFIFDPALFAANVAVFGAALSVLALLRRRRNTQGAR